MKRASYLLTIFIFLVIQFLFINPIKFTSAAASAADSWKNIYGICAVDQESADVYKNIKYAKQAGYKYIAINPSSTPKEYHKNPDCAGLKFYLIDPYFYPQVLSGYNRDIDTTVPISDKAKDFYNQRMVWKSNEPFPYNLATGYHSTGASTQFSVMWDFQQQAVIDEVVEEIISLAKSYEDKSLPFAFGGYIINKPLLAGEFYRLDEKGDNVSVGLSYWTGADSGLVHGAITHEYATYSEGKAAFYKQLRARMAREFTNAKWIVQPSLLYSEEDNDEWIYQIKDRADKDELTPDMLSQGSRQNTNFVDNANNFNSGVNITKGKVGNSQAGEVDEYKNRLFAARAGINGAWYNWFGRFGGRGDMPDFQSITEVYPRLKLIRCVPNWDNLNNVPLADRSWDGGVYQSTKSYVSSDVMYSRHPKTGKLFAVFLTLSGIITLNAGETVTSIENTDGFFVESGDGSTDVNITGNEIRLKSRKDIGKGYIVTLSSLSEGYSSTGLETEETSGSEESNGKLNGRGLSNTTWVEYVSSRGRDVKGIGTKAVQTGLKPVSTQQSTSVQTWQRVAKRTQAQKTAGLSGGEGWQMIFGIQYAPTNPKTAYFVTDTNQVWKTTNADGTNPVWNRKANGFLASGGISLAVDPTNENIVYVAGSLNMDGVDESSLNPVEGIFRTTDGGDNWTLVTSYSYSTYGPQAHFHRSARGGNHIAFAGTDIYAAPSTGGLLKSTNGTTWTRVSKNGGGYVLDTVECRNISIHPSSIAGSATCFVSATNGLWRIRDNKGSATVTKIDSGLPSYPYQIAFGTSTPNIIYAADGTNGVYRSTDGGVTFSARNNGLSSPISSGGSAKFIAMSPVNANRLFVTFQGLSGRQLYYTTDGGANWTLTSNMDEQNADGWVGGSTFGYTSNISGINGTAAPIACHPTDENIALVNGWGSQVKKTTDGGVTWKYSNTGYIGATLSQFGSIPIGWDSTNANRATFFHMDFGAMITTDGESTFKNIRTTWNGREASLCGAMRGNIIVAAIGPKTEQRIHVSRDSGASWTAVSGADANFFFATFHPQNSNIVYAGGYAPDGSKLTYKFTNIQTDNTYTTLTKNVSGIFKGDGDIVYSAKGDNLIYKSTNGGITWTAPYPYIGSGNVVRQIAIDPTNENRIYAAVQGKGVYIITDTAANGGTVLLKNEANGLALSQFGSVDTYAIVTDPNNSNVVYTGAQRTNRGQANGVFRSTDSGATWTNINGNLGSQLNVVNLSVNPHNSYVYLDSYSGTWKLPPPSTSTADTTAPNCTVSINSGDTYTKSTAVTLALSATDNVGVTGYCLSTSATKPLASATGWTSITSATNYTGNVSYTLSSGDGSKTVYVWYKDAAGNVSNTASDSITLDTTVPSITITSPTSSATYTTTSSTINLSGSASDSTSVSSVTWSNSKGGSGTASGTTSWSISSISLSSGDNVITVTVTDGANNVSTDTLTVTYNSTTLAVKSITVKKTSSPLTIDGNLNESGWSLDQSADRILSGTSNNTSTFGVLYDDNYLYVAFKVLDSNLINDSTNPWSDDSVELYLDPNNSKSTTYDTYDRQFVKGYNDNTLAATQSGTGVLHVTTNITGGYTVELAIPWSNLGVTSVTGSTLGFDVQINDDDDGAGRDNFVSWNNGASDTNYKDTSNFGNITLSATTAISDTTSPSITITSPTSGATYSSASSTINISGTASDNIGVTSVTWSNSANSTSGTASGTTSWSITGISLVSGSNPITVTARDAAGNSSTGTLTVTYTAIDIIPPVVVITFPTTNTTFSTTQSTINISGTSSDNIGVSSVSWVSDKGGSGTASGTTNWSISGISLSSGDNVITVTVTDGANNVGTDTITVTYSASSQILTTNVAYTISNITVDGNLNESDWNIITDVNKTVVGSVNNTAQFGILWDSTYLYVGVKVLDSNLYKDSTTVSDDDSIEIYIDGDHNRGTTYDSNDRQYIKGWNDSSIWEKSGKTTGVQHAWGTISGGYCVEVAIPWSNLGITPTEGMTIGFDIGYNDDDNGTGREGQAVWTGTTDSWKNTSVFGDAVLGNMSALDTTAPACSISINSGASYTNSTTVTLSLSATDDVGVTGYCLSTSSTTPLASATGWTSVTSSTNYSGSVSYTLGSGDGKKTVYVWYKDATGNVSSQALDSISLDTTAPVITITNPTYNSTYANTSSTMSLGGDVSDSASGLSSITWSNDKGGSGTTSGATGWLISSITLSSGSNIITVTAIDKANNTSTDTITVTYGAAPSVSTGSATNLTSNSATLTETVNANGLSTTVWFEYGTTSGVYGSKSATQSVNGSSDTTVSISITGLLSGKTYYYRIVAQNSAGTTYGAEKSFTTLDTTAPTGSISINGGAGRTKSTAVTLSLSSTDNVGVTGYFLSASATTPSASSVGWTSVTSTTNYSASVSYSLSSGDESKTALQALRPFHSGGDGSKAVYVWYKDAAGNVSDVASDSITLDTTVPTIAITSPTSSATYTTTSSTINLGGSVSGSTSVSSVTWSNSKGGSGTASGTINWSISGISLSSGDNVITVTATDKANNTSTDTITVTYGAVPSVSTGSATNLTSNSATLSETVNANGLSTTAWFEYGLVSGSYGSKSSTQVVSGSSNTQVSISISGLSSGKTYYYRIVAQNSAGTTYGAERSFTTLDTTAPASSININGGAAYTKSTAVTLALSATDAVGVTGYYLSTGSTTPLASATGWTSVTSTTSYSASVSYTLSSGDGSKTVYAWFKDAAGNVSNVASDSITQDTTIPVITITSPTSNSTYTATSSTVNLGGSASDSTSGVSSATWSNSKGGSGTANGTTSWSISGISLSSGDNVITVTVTDGANNTATDTITVTYVAGTIPTVTTGSAANVTSSAATLNGTVNTNGLSTTAWFEYGTSVGLYGSKSSTQSVSGSGDTTVSISVSGLSAGKTYYYRIVAQNSAGTTYGTEMSFTTGDTTGPNCSISINSGASYTNSTTVTLDLSATDDVGVTGYYLSIGSTTPLASATGWTSVTSTTSYTGNVSYTLSSGDGSKTVYVWYKDAAGNVSSSSSDSITLDMTVPTITITSPTSSSIYTTTSSTISLSGSASDNTSGANSVTWSNDKGGSGTANGTTSWSISGISLSSGDNVITVTVTDGANNVGTVTIMVSVLGTNTAGGQQVLYTFDEGDGTAVADSSGNGNNGTINGATWTTGKSGSGLSFDGMNDYVQASESPSLNISGNAITLSTWVNYRDTNKHQIFIAKPFNASSHLSPYFSYSLHGLFVNSTQLKPRFWLSIGGTGKSITSSELISPESWYHIVGVYDGSTMKIYVNGVERGSIAVSGNISSYATPLRLGANGGFTEYFSGAMDDVRIYNQALSAQEVQDLYNTY